VLYALHQAPFASLLCRRFFEPCFHIREAEIVAPGMGLKQRQQVVNLTVRGVQRFLNAIEGFAPVPHV
jgi:hypothetical protein